MNSADALRNCTDEEVRVIWDALSEYIRILDEEGDASDSEIARAVRDRLEANMPGVINAGEDA